MQSNSGQLLDSSYSSSDELASSLSSCRWPACAVSLGSMDGTGSWLPLPGRLYESFSAFSCSSLRSCSALPIGLFFFFAADFAA